MVFWSQCWFFLHMCRMIFRVLNITGKVMDLLDAGAIGVTVITETDGATTTVSSSLLGFESVVSSSFLKWILLYHLQYLDVAKY